MLTLLLFYTAVTLAVNGSYNSFALPNLPAPFLIVYHGSQGSTWFVQSLSEYKSICIIGNELIDRVKGSSKRIKFIDKAAHPPPSGDRKFLLNWRQDLFQLATENPSPYDIKMFAKCQGSELAYGYKARLTLDELKWILMSNEFKSLGVKVIFLNRNPVKQGESVYIKRYCVGI